MQLIKVYAGIAFQSVIGFGAALTEAAGYVYSQMSPDLRKEFVRLCFSREGNGYTLARTSIQSCDFALAPRAYLASAFDRGLKAFSLEDDYAYIIPLVLDALLACPELEILASPWSPPAWAKTNASMKYGGRLRRGCYGVWAQMIARYVAEYRRIGLPVTRLTVQNEPNATQIWESCRFNAAQELAFASGYLKPALAEAGLGDVKVLGWDHNKEGALDRLASFLAEGEAYEDLDGLAFHWYSGDHFEALRVAREVLGDDRELIFSEGCDAYSAGDCASELPHAEHYAHELIGDLEAGANGFFDWNILLDQRGGPNHVGNFCDAPIMYDTESATLNVRLPYYYLGHFSRFIRPGARRVLTSRYTTDLEVSAFRNPGGDFAMVVLNRTERDIPFTIAWDPGLLGVHVAQLDAPRHSIQTLVW